ncbi:MAG: hypothetical protein WAV95_18945 [Azonexus sp.]
MKLDTRHPLASATPLTAPKPAAQEDASSRAQKAQSKQLADMQEALTKLRAMPSPRVSLKRAATERANMLKRRLDMMKQMLIGASPEMAKRIAAQIKSIAKELASIGKTLATGGGNTAPTPGNSSVTPAVGNAAGEAQPPTDSEAAAGAAASEVQAVASADAAENTSNDGQHEGGESLSASQRDGLAAYAAQSAQSSGDSQGTKENDDQEKAADKALKKALSEAANALRQLIAMLRNKIGAAHKEVQEAAAHLREIERNIAGTDTASPAPPAAVAAVEVTAGAAGGMASGSINLAA